MPDRAGDGPTTHPRHVPCELARRELADFLAGLRVRHGLTVAEEVALLAERQATWAAGLVAAERAVAAARAGRKARRGRGD